MRNRNINETNARYLLGELSEEESERIERRYIADRDFLDELLAVEDDLLDQYVGGELKGRQREKFEERLLATPRQRERVRDAQILAARIGALATVASPDAKRQKGSSWFPFFNRRNLAVALPLAFAALVLLAGTGWLLTRTARLQEQVERMRAEQSAADRREQELREQLAGAQQEKTDLLRQLQEASEVSGPEGQKDAALPKKRIVPSMATFTLVPGLLRGGEAGNFALPLGVEIVQLDIQILSAQYKSYRAEVQSADGETIYQQSGLAARSAKSGESIRIKIPSRLLRGRDYVVKISGLAANGNFEDAGLYSFRIFPK
jgi:hypothetical protein